MYSESLMSFSFITSNRKQCFCMIKMKYNLILTIAAFICHNIDLPWLRSILIFSFEIKITTVTQRFIGNSNQKFASLYSHAQTQTILNHTRRKSEKVLVYRMQFCSVSMKNNIFESVVR